MSYTIAILIPSTSNKRDWKIMQDSYLYKFTLKSFLLTYNKNNNYQYKFFIGVDDDDEFYNDNININNFKRFISIMKNVEIEFIHMNNVPKGHVTIIWNNLFKIAYDNNFQYFFQCGDDIEFKTKNWIEDGISELQKNNDFGVTGPINNNMRILTQSFVSRKHMEIFGIYFPSEIVNWCCDDWINFVYYPKYIYPLKNHFCLNLGGQPRYIINNDNNFNNDLYKKTQELRRECQEIVLKSKKVFNNYLKKNNYKKKI